MRSAGLPCEHSQNESDEKRGMRLNLESRWKRFACESRLQSSQLGYKRHFSHFLISLLPDPPSHYSRSLAGASKTRRPKRHE